MRRVSIALGGQLALADCSRVLADQVKLWPNAVGAAGLSASARAEPHR